MTESVRDHKFDQVLHLLNTADDPRTPPNEAANARKLAERIMQRHAFEEEEIRQAAIRSGGQVETPEIRQFSIYKNTNRFSGHLYGMFSSLVEHCRCRLANGGWREEVDGRSRYYYVVGFASDLDFLELLYTSVRLAFSANIEPPFNPNDYDGSVARMHLAGIRWQDIAYRTGTPWPDGQKLRRAFYRWAEANNVSKEEGHRRSPEMYRRSFADGFYGTIVDRLWRMRVEAAKEQREETGDDRMAIALRSREMVVEEFLYERFPALRPKPADLTPYVEPPKKRGRQRVYKEPKQDWRAMDAGRSAARTVNLGGTGVSGSPRREIG